MALTQVLLVAGSVQVVPLDAPATSVVLTIASGVAGEVYATADGSLPVIPLNDVEVPDGQIAMPAVIGAQAVLRPPLFGDHMAIPTIRLLSSVAAVVSITW
jgi:hypothetical protein